MSRLGDKRIRLTYDDWWANQREIAAVRAAAEENARRIKEVRREFKREITAVRDEFAAEIAGIHREYGTRVGALEQARDASLSLARRWGNTAAELHDEIAEDGRHERFAPGELAAVGRRLVEFRDDAGGNAPDARFMIAWTATRDLTELRSKVAERAQEWETLRSACVSGLTVLRERWQELATWELAQGDEVAKVDVAHWSGGAHAELGAELTSALRAVADPKTAPDTASLTTLLGSELDRLAGRLERVFQNALATCRHAQLRAEVFTDVAGRMADRGWHIVDRQMGFEGDDTRADLVGVIRNFSGAQLRIRLPAPGDDRQELPVRFERIAREDLPDNVVDKLGELMQAVVDDAAQGWARTDRVEELPSRDEDTDDVEAEREHL